MRRSTCQKLMQAAIVTLIAIAIFQELEKPASERKWHGKVIGFVPYDFRRPTLGRIKDTYWNPYERRVLMPMLFGVGWTVNLYRVLENIGIIKQDDVSEDSFLKPTQSMKQVLG